ncbi:MAG: hypothetical protein V3575_07025 [Candidatus Absconditabacteria bacterium]
MDAARASFFLFKKFWPEAIDSVVFGTDKKPIDLNDFFENVVVVSDDAYSERVRFSLDRIKTKYVILLLDDYFLSKPIDSSKVESLITTMKENQVNYFKLIGLPKSFRGFKPYNGTYLIKSNTHYGISLQPSIWEVNFLKKACKDSADSAWKFETNLAKLQKEKTFKGIQYNTNFLAIKNGILKGKLFPSTNKFLQECGYSPLDRDTISFFSAIKFHISQKSISYIPNKVRFFLKKIARLFGKTFYTHN